ncbi:MAG: hypothetical protein EP329_06605 [Deltaproteobacteria bacterium]|nr:MAG: hypothetical protein EP329_06605 [Deltaproteobacteria bacterium]
MSTFFQADVACPHCGDVASRSVAASLNAQRSPRYRQEILERTFQRPTCGRCKQQFLIHEPFLYLDLSAKQLIAVFAPALVEDWPELEEEVVDAWEAAFGPDDAPAIAQALGEGLVLRTVFGLEALREKLVCAEHGVDDAQLEALKLQLLLDGTLPGPESAPRLAEVEDDGETLVIVCEPVADLTTGAARQAVLRAPRRLLELDLDLGLPPLDAGTWVDVGRILVGADDDGDEATVTDG